MKFLKFLFCSAMLLFLFIQFAATAHAIPGVPDGSCSNWPPVASSGDPATSAAQAAANAQCDGRDYDSTIDQCFWRNANELGTHVQGWQCIITGATEASSPTPTQPPTSGAPNLGPGDCSNWPPVASSGDPATSAAQAAANAQCDGRDYDSAIDQCFWRNANEFGTHVQGWQCIIYASSGVDPTAVPPTATTVPPTDMPPTTVPPTSTGVPPTATTQPSTSGAPNLGPGDCSNWPPVASSGDPATSAAQAAANAQCDGRDYDSAIDQCFWRNANEFGTHVQGWQCIIYASSGVDPTAVPPPATTVPPTDVPPTAVPPTSTGVPPTATTQPSTSGAPNLGPGDCSNWPPVASSGDPATSAAQAAANAQCDGRDYDSTIDQCFWRNANEFGTHAQGWQCIIYASSSVDPTAVPPPATTVPPTAVSPTAVPPTAVPPISTGVPPTATTQPSTSGAPNLGPSDCSNWPPVASSGDPATSAAQAAANGQCDGRDYDSVIDQCFWRDANEFGTHVQGWQCIIYGSTDGEPTAVPPTSEPPTDVTPTAVPPTDGAPNLGRDECSNWPPVASSGDPASSAARSAANAQCEGRDYDSAIDQCFWRNANEFGTHVQGWQCIITNVSGDDDDDEPDSELIPGLGAGECSNWPPVVSSGNPATSAAQSAANAQCGGRDYDDAVDQCFWRDENELGTHAQGWQCIISAPPVDDPVTDPGSDPNTGSSTGLRMTGVRFNSSNNTLEWDIPVNPPFEIRQFRIIKNNHDNNGDIYLDVPGALNTESGYNILGTKYTYSLADLTPGTSYTIMAYYDEGGGTRTWGPKSAYATVHGANQSAPRIPPFGERSNFQAAHSFLAGAWRVDFDEEFRGNTNQQLSDRGSANGGQRWFFGGPPGSDLQLAGSRLTADRLHATLDGSDRGILSMDVDVASSRYSYLATADDNPNNDTDEGNEEYYLDPASELFLEASVRLDHAAPAYNAWWAFWLMAPGTHNCDGELSGSNVAHNAYDGQAETGTEIDIFELVPDNGNGFNAAIFKSHKGFFQCKKDENGSVVDSTLETETEVIRPTTGDFSYFTPGDINGHIFNYMDGQFHNIGLYYSADRLAFFVDDILIWETQNTDFITDQARESIRLTWEVDNSNVWGIRRDSQSTFAERTRFDRLLLANEVPDNPTVYVDYVKVWQKAVRTAPVGTAEEQRSDALTQAVKALESYAAKSGTFAVAGGGFEGSGEGWYLFNGDPDHPKSIVSVLVDEGYLNEKDLIKDPLHVGTGSTVGDLRVYACKDRVAVFSDQGTESASAADSLWWDENECSREPIEAFDATYFKLSRTLASVQEPLRVFLPVSFD